MALVYTQNLSFAYPGKEKKTLDNVSLTIEKGEYVVLCGKKRQRQDHVTAAPQIRSDAQWEKERQRIF